MRKNINTFWLKKCFVSSHADLQYRIYPKYLDTSTPYHVCSKIWTSTIHYPMLCLKIAEWVANSVDPNESHVLRRLIWVYTVCSGLSVRIHMVNKVLCLYLLVHVASCSYSSSQITACFSLFLHNICVHAEIDKTEKKQLEIWVPFFLLNDNIIKTNKWIYKLFLMWHLSLKLQFLVAIFSLCPAE